MMYTNSNKEATKSFSFRSKTITKHVEMRNFLRLFYSNLGTYVITALVFSGI